MSKNILIILLITVLAVGGVYFYIINSKEFKTIISPYQLITDKNTKEEEKNLESVFSQKKEQFGDVINILLLGVDSSEGRRSRGQTGFNTDSMIMVSVNTKTNRILLTSVPRDLWINGNKINALYTVYGEEVLVDAYEKITGQEIDGIIRVDFDQFMWLVDSFGGVPVNVETTFVDDTFPDRQDKDVETITFAQGPETLYGWRALTFARSRHGNNGEGSDLMRAKRQHLILKGMVNAISQNGSKFWPMNIENLYNAIKTEEIYTTLTLEDCTFLWDFYKDKDKYQVESLVVGADYVYHPGMYPNSEYRAWVFVAKEPGFANLHRDITAKLDGTFVDPNTEIIPTDTAPINNNVDVDINIVTE